MGVAEFAKIATPPPLPSCLSFIEIRFRPGNLRRSVGRAQVSWRHKIWGDRESTRWLIDDLFEEELRIFHCIFFKVIAS